MRPASRPVRRALLAAVVLGSLAASGCARTETSAPPLVDPSPDLVSPGRVHVESGLDRDATRRAAHVVLVAQTLYTFWDTGRARYLDRAVDPAFEDRTLPPGRPQGPAGPVAASRTFRAAVPDLSCELADLYVTGDTFTARLVFRGHFTGSYLGVEGRGQTIEFGAIDIQHLGDGRTITEDWHLEDNLTFLLQAGVVTLPDPDA